MTGTTSAEAHQEALAVARATPSLLVPRHVRAGQVRDIVHGTGVLGRFNAAVAVRITKVVGTMYCAYVFGLIALVALPAALQQGSPTVLVNWVSSNFLQLVLLPIIMVGQNVIQAANDARAEADHKTLTAVHSLTVAVHTINEHQTEILQELRKTGRS